MFIGINVPAAFRQLDFRPHPTGSGPDAVLTPFGWTVQGLVDASSIILPSTQSSDCHTISTESEDDGIIEKMWAVKDKCGSKDDRRALLKQKDENALATYSNTISLKGNRYEIGVPFISPSARLPNNYKAAVRRLYAVESRFKSDPPFAHKYTKAIEMYEELGFARRLQRHELVGPEGRTWYLPHFMVIHPAKPEKPRLVFDAAARHRGVCLNDVLHSGPVMLVNLHELLIQFRENPFGVSMDIEKMFLQIRVREQDQPVFRFLWRRPGSKGPPIAYQMLVVVFGAASSPTTSAFVLHRTVDDNPMYSDVGERVKTNFYVDNYLDSFDSAEEASSTCKRLKELLALGGFNLGQLSASSREVVKSFPRRDLAKPDLNVDLDDLPVERTLGILWNAERDHFFFQLNAPSEASTKRQVLAAVSSIFDPLGLITCVTITLKVFLQDTWRVGKDPLPGGKKARKLMWDDTLPEELLRRWRTIVSDLKYLKDLHIPRALRQSIFPPDDTSFELHIYCDASVTAYGAMVFLRCEAGDQISVQLVTSKVRVAPVKQLSVPRLELEAAVLGCRLGAKVRRTLRKPIHSIRFWTDSDCVLYWLSSFATLYSPFVANRKEAILELSDASEWSYVPGGMNPADDLSRGIKAKNLSSNHRFYQGTYLSRKKEAWPSALGSSSRISSSPSVAELEIIRPVAICVVGTIDPQSTSSIARLTIIEEADTLTSLKRAVGKLEKPNANLEVEDLRLALESCIRTVQAASFSGELRRLAQERPLPRSSRLLKLTPYLDEKGILRVGGRLQHSVLREDAKHPIILPAKHRLTELIIAEAHQQCLHSQTERTLYEVRASYWILQGRRAVRSVVKACFECRKRNAPPLTQIMAPLPAERLQPYLPPFTNVGVDYFGPLYVTVKRSQEKRYGALFTCLATRAVHIEIAKLLDVDSFLMAWRRFVALRGQQKGVWSDNGTNLVAGEQELRLGIERLSEDPQFSKKMTDSGFVWKFSPPSGPHFGGIYERMVRSAKTALRVILGAQTVSEEVLTTALCEATSMLNARPLTDLSVDPQDESPLTPNHFLLGRPHPHIPPDVFETTESSLSRRRWTQAQELAEKFWKRWLVEYVPALTEKHKWTESRRNVAVDDLVLIVDNNSPRGKWPTGRVTELIISKQGKKTTPRAVRSVRVKTDTGEYIRPIVKLCLLREAGEAVDVPGENPP